MIDYYITRVITRKERKKGCMHPYFHDRKRFGRVMEKTVGGPDGHGSSSPGRGEGGPEPSKFFSLGKTQRVFKSPPKPLIINHGNKEVSVRSNNFLIFL